jgi:hypothetical protein
LFEMTQSSVKGTHTTENKFLHFTNPLVPPTAECWVNALASVDQSKPPAKPLNGFVFPEPRMFLSSPEPSKQREYVFRWLKLRPAFLYRADNLSFADAIINRQTWRDILFGKQAPELETLNGRSKLTGTQGRSAKRQYALSDAFKGCIADDSSVVLSSSLEGAATWRNTTYSSASALTDAVIKEVMGELAILNFRIELSALDDKMCDQTNNDSDSDTRVAQALFLAGTGALLSVSFEPFPGHHASSGVRDRGPWIGEIRNLINSWDRQLLPPDVASASIAAFSEKSDKEVLAFEKVVVQQYVQCVFDQFGRPASLPVSC